jgi:radical SAM protein with 4Fe4S-binding SPASM domain
VGRHDWLRGAEGSEAAVVALIRRLRERGTKVSVQTKIHRNNIGSLPATYELMKELGIDLWTVSRIYSLGEWRKEGLPPLDADTVLENYLALIRRYIADGNPFRMALGEGVFAGRRNGENSMPQARDYKPGTDDGSGAQLSCAFRIRPYLLPDSRLIPCVAMTGSELERMMPRLIDTPLVEIYSRPDGVFLSTVDITVDTVVSHNAECQSCEHCVECGGGCRADAVLSGGGILGKGCSLCYAFKSGYRARLKEIAGV